jgi:hypothetical protein
MPLLTQEQLNEQQKMINLTTLATKMWAAKIRKMKKGEDTPTTPNEDLTQKTKGGCNPKL